MKQKRPAKAPKKRVPVSGRVTLDDLAGMMADGFRSVDKRLDGIDERLDGIDGRLDGFETRFNMVEEKLNTLHSDVLSMHFDYRKLKTRMENMEIRVFGTVQEP